MTCVSAWYIGSVSLSMIFWVPLARFLKKNQRHAKPVSAFDLVAAEIKAEAVHQKADVIVITAYGQSRDCRCPDCGTTSHRNSSRYPRMLADLACAGRRIELHLTVRRFVCNVECRRKIFAERFCDDIVPSVDRRTARHDTAVRHIGRELGGRRQHGSQIVSRF